MTTYLNAQELNLLQNLIHQDLQTITSEDWQESHLCYGNLLITTNQNYINISNDYKMVRYFRNQEELVGFSVSNVIDPHHFKSIVASSALLAYPIHKTITNIQIVRDTLTLNFEDGYLETHHIDQAIIFHLGSLKLLIMLDSVWMALNHIYLTEDIAPYLYTTKDIASQWNFTEEEYQGTPYTSTITREIISLADETSKE